MGLFQSKKDPKADTPVVEETTDGVQLFFDGYFQELQRRGNAHFEKVVDENSTEFKSELDATISEANSKLKEYIAARLDEQLAENDKAVRTAQDAALKSLDRNASALEEQHKALSEKLQKNIGDQEAMLTSMSNDNIARMVAMKDAQDAAMESLNRSAKALEEQHKQLSETLEKNVAHQETVLVEAFQDNMAKIIEHYLLGALGDQYDLKAQLPVIIKQMEENKQAIVDDMKL